MWWVLSHLFDERYVRAAATAEIHLVCVDPVEGAEIGTTLLLRLWFEEFLRNLTRLGAVAAGA